MRQNETEGEGAGERGGEREEGLAPPFGVTQVPFPGGGGGMGRAFLHLASQPGRRPARCAASAAAASAARPLAGGKASKPSEWRKEESQNDK